MLITIYVFDKSTFKKKNLYIHKFNIINKEKKLIVVERDNGDVYYRKMDGIDKSIKIKLSRWGLDFLFPFLLSFLDINYIILIVTFIIVNILKFKRTYCIISCIEINWKLYRYSFIT